MTHDPNNCPYCPDGSPHCMACGEPDCRCVVESLHSNIRDVLGGAIGQRIADITQNDPGEQPSYVMFMLEDGTYMRFYVREGEGFDTDVEMT